MNIVLFRQDLRICDQPALFAAAQTKEPVLCLYIHDLSEYGEWKPGRSSLFWLTHSLQKLQEEVEKIGGRLVVRVGKTIPILKEVVEKCDAKRIFWNIRYEPAFREQDEKTESALNKLGIGVEKFDGNLLYPPGSITDLKGKPYQVYTFFWKASRKLGGPKKPLGAVRKLEGWKGKLSSDPIDFSENEALLKFWKPGEEAAWARASLFLNRVEEYHHNRDFPSLDGTSLLSPYLHFGEISPKELWDEVVKKCSFAKAEGYLKELMWREFAYHILVHNPTLPTHPMKQEFEKFPWKKDEKRLKAWEEGMTGYPLVDAGMRQLKKVGWMHNRVRMVVASFLVKHLLQHWLDGARWFWDHLVDADLANNTMGWQWSAGCGPDAAPFFRIFNPTIQAEKFDPEGKYIRKYVPEIAKLPNKYLFAPWDAPESVLEDAGIELGKTYPKPIVDHEKAREYALSAFKKLK